MPELDRLASLSRSENNTVKNFLTSPFDNYRPPYGAHSVSVKRRVVFAGTVNPPPGAGYLKDITGNRRFWPVRTADVGPIDLEALARDRDQLWAEAVALYKAGTKWWPATDAERAMCRGEQEARQKVGAWDERIARWLAGTDCGQCEGSGKSKAGPVCSTCSASGKAPDRFQAGVRRPAGEFVTLDDVLSGALEVPKERWPACYRQVAESMARLGWRTGPRVTRGRVKVTPYYEPGKGPNKAGGGDGEGGGGDGG